ncbi:hypothetical protein ABH988_004295 [Bradyrhizobium ottawaense]
MTTMSPNCSSLESRPSALTDSLQVDALHVRGGADDAGGGLDVLRLDRFDDVARGQAVLGRLLRIDPDPHRIVTGAVELDVADAVDPRQAVLDVEHRVVAQIGHVVAAVRRQQMHDHGEVGRGLLGDDAELAHHGRQARLGLLHAVLHQLRRLVGIGAEPERHRQRHRAVGGRLARHVEHVLDAVDLLLDRGRYRLRDHLGIGAGIGGAHQDRRGHHVRIFRDRHREQRDQAGKENQDRQHAGKNRTIDEEFREIHGFAPGQYLVRLRQLRRHSGAWAKPASPESRGEVVGVS